MVQIKAELAAEDAPPPPYVGAGPSTSTGDVPADAARCNMLDIARAHNRVKGAYVVDPALTVPESLLAPAEGEGPRPNLRLASTHWGVEADVWVLAADVKRTRLVFDSQYGSVDVRLHALGNRPCAVEIRAGYGRVNVMVPRDFVGAVSASTTYGSISVPPQLATLSEAQGEGKYFVGDLGLVGPDGWNGSSIQVTAPQGRIKFTFGEETAAKKSKWASWFS